MDRPRDGVRALTAPVDLHCHSTASDGLATPRALVARAAAAGLGAVALTDHDTVAGVAAAAAAGRSAGVRVVAGCEFSVASPWGEQHLLGYFLPVDDAGLLAWLDERRAERESRARRIVSRLNAFGLALREADVGAYADGGAVGRPHVARALVAAGHVRSVHEAFDRWLGRGRPAFIDKPLPPLAEVVGLVHALGGVCSAAHLKGDGTAANVAWLAAHGVDALETRHPSHDGDTRARLTDLALAHGLARSGGSDWHGDGKDSPTHGVLGGEDVPAAWLDELERRRPAATGVS